MGNDKIYKELVSKVRKESKEIVDMQARAQEILDYFKINDLSGGVPLIEILTKLGFKVYQSDLEPDGLSAYIAVDPKFEDVFESNKIICVNVGDTIGHKRFALAHELAHYLFDFEEEKKLYYYNTYFQGKEYSNFKEKRASKFAANLLMPTYVFLEKHFELSKKTESKVDIVSQLAQYFLVSPAAVLIRFDEVGIEGYSD